MPKTPQPWYWKGRGWYLETNRKRTFLGKERDVAFRTFYAIMSGNKPATNSISELVDAFSSWIEKNRATKTAKWYKDILRSFLKFHPNLSVDELKPFHVQKWMDSADVSNGTKRNYCRVVQRLCAWACEQGYTDKSPIAQMKKPAAGFRDVVIHEDEYRRILEAATTIRPLIEFAWLTGARAAEIIKIKREHIDGSRVILPRSEEKMRRAVRVIYLNEKAMVLIQGCQSGYVFRNQDGEPWKIAAINSAFFRMKKKLGKQYCLTMFRHSWAHRMLTSGVDALAVASMMGHAPGSSTLSKHYAHISHAVDHLTAAAEKAS